MVASSPLDRGFAGSIPAIYDMYFVPMLFEPYAADIATRVRARFASTVVEIAAGTGVVTRALASALPVATAIVATDLNQAMLDRAEAVGTSRPVEWRQADAMKLPFPDAVFDVVVCQFGAMFFPDKAGAFSEARRVLAPGGAFIFNVWDRLSENEFAETVTTALEPIFPSDPPRFMDRVPHGYHDTRTVERDLLGGGFDRSPEIFTVDAVSRSASARAAAIGFCQGTPLRTRSRRATVSFLARRPTPQRPPSSASSATARSRAECERTW